MVGFIYAKKLLYSLVLCGWGVSFSTAHAASVTQVTPLIIHDLKGLSGEEGALLRVDYPPGASDPIHRHNASVFVYVLQGVIAMQPCKSKGAHL
ncbi:cupin domain-containing protein [Swingsia samuiensis]|uniref:cupin domain-containing protein n=1 Tax=Swingsia samuiensis TaxID=1293412 RepID=UPI001FE4990B|nr:cupin domain-containing protein [Swingsia samuiensis]